MEPKCYADAKIQRQARCLPEQEIITFGYPMALHGARRKLGSTDENTGTASQEAQTRGEKKKAEINRRHHSRIMLTAHT